MAESITQYQGEKSKIFLTYHFSSKDLVAGHMSSAYFVSRAAEISVIADLQQKQFVMLCSIIYHYYLNIQS